MIYIPGFIKKTCEFTGVLGVWRKIVLNYPGFMKTTGIDKEFFCIYPFNAPTLCNYAAPVLQQLSEKALPHRIQSAERPHQIPDYVQYQYF